MKTATIYCHWQIVKPRVTMGKKIKENEFGARARRWDGAR